MKRIVVSLAAAALMTASLAAPAFADGWGRHSHEVTAADVLLWPLTIPAAIVGSIAQATIPHPVVYEAPVSAYDDPVAYAGPRAYYSPAPRGYYAPAPGYRPYGYYDRGYRHGHGGYYHGRDYGRRWGRW